MKRNARHAWTKRAGLRAASHGITESSGSGRALRLLGDVGHPEQSDFRLKDRRVGLHGARHRRRGGRDEMAARMLLRMISGCASGSVMRVCVRMSVGHQRVIRVRRVDACERCGRVAFRRAGDAVYRRPHALERENDEQYEQQELFYAVGHGGSIRATAHAFKAALKNRARNGARYAGSSSRDAAAIDVPRQPSHEFAGQRKPRNHVLHRPRHAFRYHGLQASHPILK